jgi:hypothetical protein
MNRVRSTMSASVGGLSSWLNCLKLSSFLVVGCLWLVGCESSSNQLQDSAYQEVVNRMRLDAQPSEISSILSVYESFQPDQTVTIAGRIYAEGMSPFDPNEATFTVIELPKPGHNHEDPGDCPFCKRELRNAKIAMVKLLGDDGLPIPKSAEKLLDLQKNQDIVLTGVASQVGDTLVVSMKSFYLLSREDAEALSQSFRQPQSVPESEQPSDGDSQAS